MTTHIIITIDDTLVTWLTLLYSFAELTSDFEVLEYDLLLHESFSKKIIRFFSSLK